MFCFENLDVSNQLISMRINETESTKNCLSSVLIVIIIDNQQFQQKQILFEVKKLSEL